MINIFRLPNKIFNMLKTPLGENLNYIAGVLSTFVWRRSFLRLGRKAFISFGAKIVGSEYISVGNNFYSGEFLWLEAVRNYRGKEFSPEILIGDNVSCSQMVHIAAVTKVIIEDGVLIGSKVHITDHSHGSYRGSHHDDPNIPPALRFLTCDHPVLIKKNVWIGDGVVILPGVTVGSGSIIGANSVVSNDIPSNVIAVGSPARPIKIYDDQVGKWMPILLK